MPTMRERAVSLMERDPEEAYSLTIVRTFGIDSIEAFGVIEDFLRHIIPEPDTYPEWVKAAWFHLANGVHTGPGCEIWPCGDWSNRPSGGA